MTAKCEHTKCKFKQSNRFAPYCEKHQANLILDDIKARGLKPCGGFTRGCRVELAIDFAYSKCDDCRAKEATKCKELKDRRIAERAEFEKANPGMSLCVECNCEFTIVVGPSGRPLQRCPDCYEKQNKREAARKPRSRALPRLMAEEGEIVAGGVAPIKSETVILSAPPTDDTEWKQVPPELVFDYGIEASKFGKLRWKNTKSEISTWKSNSGSTAHYSAFKLEGTTMYVHRLVFYAHSGLTPNVLKNVTVVFTNELREESIVDGMFTNHYKDLMYREGINNEIIIPEESTGIHPLYGEFMYGYWYTLYAPLRDEEHNLYECSKYELCILDRTDIPCAIRHIDRPDILLNMETLKATAPSATISQETGEPIKYKLIHLVLASAFPEAPADETVDHIDMNPSNHHITNLQWATMADNARGGQVKSVEARKHNMATRPKECPLMKGEIWRKLETNEHTAALYEVSNMGRIKNKEGITRGSINRDNGYRYVTISIESGVHVKRYVHRLVCQVFCTDTPDIEIPAKTVVKHKDVTDGSTYLPGTTLLRNYACDLEIGTKTENNLEYHANKKAKAKRRVIIIP